MRLVMVRITLALILVAFLIIPLSVLAQGYQPPHTEPGPAVDVIRFRSFAEEIAPAAIEKGDMDVYFYNMRVSKIIQLEKNPDLTFVRAPSTSLSIILNPAPSTEDSFNPFQLKKVRQAVQYLINRDFIAKEIYKGRAVPMLAHVSPYEYDYITIFDLLDSMGIRYDPELGRKMIAEALTEAGAVMKDGKWYYNNKPIVVKFVIRTEDERREIGEALTKELERAGLTVERIYHPFAQAILRVYTTDPAEFQWHLYTEGWGKGALERYDFATINQMCAPWLGNMPGWLERGYWQYSNKQLDELGQRLFKGEFKDKQERDKLYRQMTELCLDEAVRIWVATVLTSAPVRKEVKGISEDLGAGVRSIWFLRNAYVEGKDEITVGHLWVWTSRSVWNPVAGFNDVYSVDIWRNVVDPPIVRNPFTGIPMPFRAKYEVETAGPDGKLKVPEDAVVWDAEQDKWVRAPSGTEAVSKVTFDYSLYTQSKWHHGIRISMADILYRIAQIFDITYDKEKSKIEAAISATSKPILDTFKAFRVVDDHTLEVYVDFWHFDKNYIAEYASLWSGGMPWEVLYLMDKEVFEKPRPLYTYSDTAAARLARQQLSLILKEHVSVLRKTLLDIRRNGEYPSNVFNVLGKEYETPENAVARYDALLNWFNQHGHMVVSSGPFILATIDPAAQYAELKAYRDPSYPFKPGDWFFGRAQRPEITSVSSKVNLAAERSITVRVRGEPPLHLKYVLRNPVTGAEVASGVVEPRDGVADIPLETSLTEGFYTLHLLLYSASVSMVNERKATVEIVEETVQATATTTATQPQAGTTTQITTIAATTETSAGGGGIPLLLPAAVAVIVVAAVAVLFLTRRGKKTP